MDVFKHKILYGKIIIEIEIEMGNSIIKFHINDGSIYQMFHDQDCSESVSIDDICGELDDLLDSPIIKFEEVTEDGEDGNYDTFTWTFYKISSLKGYVDLKWYGTSNGYYSESVSVRQIKDADPIELQRSKKLQKLYNGGI